MDRQQSKSTDYKQNLSGVTATKVCQWTGSTQSLSGVTATKVCQWTGSNQSLPKERQQLKSANGAAATKSINNGSI